MSHGEDHPSPDPDQRHVVLGRASSPGGEAKLRGHLPELRKALENAGWDILRWEHPLVPLVLQRGPSRYVLQLRGVTRSGIDDLIGGLADAFLRGRVAAGWVDAQPLPVVLVPNATQRGVEALREYARIYLAGEAWGVVDDRGFVLLNGPGLEAVRAEPRWQPRPAAAQPANPFSDLGQWLLKVLLAGDLPEELLRAPRQPLRNASRLAEAAGVSLPTVTRLLGALRPRGFLAEEARLRLRAVDELLQQWAKASSRPSAELPARWALRPSNPKAHLRDRLEQIRKQANVRDLRVCMGLYAASDELGLGVVHGAPMDLYVERIDEDVLRALGLVAVPDGERVDVWVRQPVFPESLFRGAVERKGLFVTDVLQCWLDVQDHPLRGQEQAEHIYRKVIRPCLLD